LRITTQKRTLKPDHNKRTSCEKASNLLAVLHGQDADVLHSFQPKPHFEDIVGALKGRYGDHRLAASYRAQLKAALQLIGESPQKFAAAVEQLAHLALVGIPVEFMQTETALHSSTE
jgi:hypothetical protein